MYERCVRSLNIDNEGFDCNGIKILTDGPPPTMHTSLCTCEDTLSSSSSTDSIGIEKKSSSSAYVCRLGFLVESLPCAPLNDASSKTEKIKILEDIVAIVVVVCLQFM